MSPGVKGLNQVLNVDNYEERNDTPRNFYNTYHSTSMK